MNDVEHDLFRLGLDPVVDEPTAVRVALPDAKVRGVRRRRRFQCCRRLDLSCLGLGLGLADCSHQCASSNNLAKSSGICGSGVWLTVTLSPSSRTLLLTFCQCGSAVG